MKIMSAQAGVLRLSVILLTASMLAGIGATQKLVVSGIPNLKLRTGEITAQQALDKTYAFLKRAQVTHPTGDIKATLDDDIFQKRVWIMHFAGSEKGSLNVLLDAKTGTVFGMTNTVARYRLQNLSEPERKRLTKFSTVKDLLPEMRRVATRLGAPMDAQMDYSSDISYGVFGATFTSKHGGYPYLSGGHAYTLNLNAKTGELFYYTYSAAVKALPTGRLVISQSDAVSRARAILAKHPSKFHRPTPNPTKIQIGWAIPDNTFTQKPPIPKQHWTPRLAYAITFGDFIVLIDAENGRLLGGFEPK